MKKRTLADRINENPEEILTTNWRSETNYFDHRQLRCLIEGLDDEQTKDLVVKNIVTAYNDFCLEFRKCIFKPFESSDALKDYLEQVWTQKFERERVRIETASQLFPKIQGVAQVGKNMEVLGVKNVPIPKPGVDMQVKMYDDKQLVIVKKPGVDKQEAIVEVPAEDEQETIVNELVGIFWGNRENVEDFLTRIKYMKPRQITALVKKWVAENKISEYSCHRPLYRVLQKHGLYDKTEKNWNQQLKQ